MTPLTMDTPHTLLAGEWSRPCRTQSLGWEGGLRGWDGGLVSSLGSEMEEWEGDGLSGVSRDRTRIEGVARRPQLAHVTLCAN